jgi:PmbA protein
MNFVKFALKQGADDVVIEKVDGEMKQVRFANNAVKICQNWDISKYEIFLSYKKRIMNTTVFDISEDSVKNSIKTLVKSAKMIKPNLEYFGIAKGPFKYKQIPRAYDKKIINAPIIDIVESMINSALEYSKNTAGVIYTNNFEREIETSSNVSASEKMTSIQLSIRAFNEEDESGHAASCSKTLNSINPEKIGKKAGEIAKLAKTPEKLESGKYNVIFDPLAIANLLGLVGRSSSAFIVDVGVSFLRGKFGKRVGSDKVTLEDDGRIKNGYGSTMFDDEGVPTQKTTIIEKGILKNYLHNTSTAKKYNTKTTGNAGLIAPSTTNIILKEGKSSKEKLFDEVKNGLYITNVWYTRFQNYLTGDFSTIPRDGIFLIKNGEIVKSIKGIRVSDNLQRILENVISISNKPEWIMWWGLETQTPVLTPYVLVSNANITQSTM